MPGFKPWDIVRVPFPYTSRPVAQYRPALVVAVPDTGGGAALLWVVMITSAENRAWHGDIPVAAGGTTGLPVASLIRSCKIATIERDAATKLGELPPGDIRSRVGNAISAIMIGSVDAR